MSHKKLLVNAFGADVFTNTCIKTEARPYTINFPLMLAPMVGLSHVVLRQLIRQYLPASAQTIWPTEMLNSKKIPHENIDLKAESMRAPNELDLVPQILGNDEISIKASVEKLKQWGAIGIDINMGCPVQKALRHNYGVALMGDPEYAAEVVRMTARNTDLPVSVKLRAGLQSDQEYLLKFVLGLLQAGAKWICLHPRTAAQKRRGIADWAQIKWLNERIDLPIIGNGDIQTSDDVLQMLQETRCEMVMSGRALAARPWLVWQVAEDLGFDTSDMACGFDEKISYVAANMASGDSCKTPDKVVSRSLKAPRTPEEEGREYGRALLKYMELMELYYQSFTEELRLRKLRFHIKTTCVWLPFGHVLFARSTKAKTWSEVKDVIADFFQSSDVNMSCITMSPRTDLRE